MALSLPLIVTLWNIDPDFGPPIGPRRYVFEDTPDLTQTAFNDQTNWVEIHPGPGYDAYKAANAGQEPNVALYGGANYQYPVLKLIVGNYHLRRYHNFGGMVSSIRFNDPFYEGSPAGLLVPLLVSLFEHENFKGRRLDLIKRSANIPNEFGNEFNDTVTAVRVTAGPNFAPGQVVKLFRDIDYRGGGIELPPGDYPNIGNSHGFNDVVSSIMVG